MVDLLWFQLPVQTILGDISCGSANFVPGPIAQSQIEHHFIVASGAADCLFQGSADSVGELGDLPEAIETDLVLLHPAEF